MTGIEATLVGEPARGGSRFDWPLRLAAVAAVALWLHAACWATVPPDMRVFLLPWYQHILDHGRIAAFAAPFSNYTPPYLYLLSAASLADGLLGPMTVIKSLSVAGTALLAFAVASLLKALGTEPRRAVAVFLLPTATLDAALLGQCDALWAGACIFAVAAMIRGNTIAALAWCGVGIAFKAQAAFIAPFIIGALIGRRAPLWQWALPPAVFALLMLPAALLGWPASDLATIYLRQVEHFDFPGNLANPWMWGTAFAPDSAQRWYILGYAAAAMAALGIGALAARSVRSPQALATIALLSAFALPFLLPKMHERYWFLADVLALAIALARPDRRNITVAITVQLSSMLALLSYMYDRPAAALAGALVAGAALAAIAIPRRSGSPSLGHGPNSSGYSASATYRYSQAAAPNGGG